MKDHTATLLPEVIYHVYNRAVGSEKLFVSDDNYLFFLKQYDRFVFPVADTFAYCLMPNHFHFLIRCRSEKELLTEFLKTAKGKRVSSKGFLSLSELEREKLLSSFISQRFSHFFNSYAQSFNRQQERHGTLFSRPFQRKAIDGTEYFQKVIVYIHGNPLAAGMTNKHGDWKFDSYRTILSDGRTQLQRNEVLDWFEGRENFMSCHLNKP